MNTITVILEPDPDGTLHLPLPPGLRHGKVKVEARLERAEHDAAPRATSSLKGFGALRGKIWMAPDFNEPLEDLREYME